MSGPLCEPSSVGGQWLTNVGDQLHNQIKLNSLGGGKPEATSNMPDHPMEDRSILCPSACHEQQAHDPTEPLCAPSATSSSKSPIMLSRSSSLMPAATLLSIELIISGPTPANNEGLADSSDHTDKVPKRANPKNGPTGNL